MEPKDDPNVSMSPPKGCALPRHQPSRSTVPPQPMAGGAGRLSGSHAGQLFSSRSPRDMPPFVVYGIFYLYEFLLLSMYSTSHIWESDLKEQVQLVDDLQRSVADYLQGPPGPFQRPTTC